MPDRHGGRLLDRAERWRPVRAYRGRVAAGVFEASTGGHARLAGSAVPLTEVPDKDGYLRVKHQGRWYSVAELVALAWHGAPQVRHLGDSNQDNKPTELAWGSARENERDKRDKRRKGKGEVSPPSQRLQPVTGDVQG